MTDSREVEGDTDMVNWEIVQPTTGAQYFHLFTTVPLLQELGSQRVPVYPISHLHVLHIC